MTTHLDPADTERALREALGVRAREIRPADRLDAILREAAEPAPSATRGRWLTGLGVAAASAAIAGAVWTARPHPEGTPTLPGGTPSATLPSPTVSTPTSPTTQAPVGSAQAIYRVGTNGGSDNRPGLVREFWTAAIGSQASEPDRVTAAVGESLRRSELWRGVTLEGVDVTGGAITLRLSGSGDRAPDLDRAQLAVSSLVWTAQGAVGRGDLPVTMRPVGDGALLGRIAASSPFTRAATAPDALCDIWIDDPAPGAALPASKAVTIRGQAVAWEANVEWQLRRGTATLREGFVTASIGAPSRGTFAVDLGVLEPGTYVFRAFTTSMSDGSVMSERLVTFTVR